MLRPSREEFKALASTHTVIPVWREGLADLITPVAAFVRCVGDETGILAAVEAILATYRSPELEGLPPFHGGLVGCLGYDIVREIERLPDVPRDDHGLPDAVLLVVGDLAVFDHWRQRVSLISAAYVPPGASDAELDEAYDAAAQRIDELARDGARPLDELVVEPPDPEAPAPDVVRTVSAGAYAHAVAVAKEHIFAGD